MQANNGSCGQTTRGQPGTAGHGNRRRRVKEGGEDSLAGIILPARQCRQVQLPVSGQNFIVDGDATVASSQAALVGEVEEAKEAENSLARPKG